MSPDFNKLPHLAEHGIITEADKEIIKNLPWTKDEVIGYNDFREQAEQDPTPLTLCPRHRASSPLCLSGFADRHRDSRKEARPHIKDQGKASPLRK